MTTLTLERYAYTPTETQGRLITDTGEVFHSLERPWIKALHPGGASFESCIPDGRYTLIKHTRPSGDKVVALLNPRLGVWYQKEDRPDVWGRYLVLIHSGNYVTDVVGCIAPGLSRTIHENRVMVGSSRAAMNKLKVQRFSTLVIKPALGAKD